MDIRDGLITIKNFVSKEEGEKLSKYILEYESTIKSLGPDIYGGTSNDSLTGRFNVFNYLEHEPGEILNPKLKDLWFKPNPDKLPVGESIIIDLNLRVLS